MAKWMKGLAAFFCTAAVCLVLLYRSLRLPLLETLAITSGTIAYHFVMRLLVGGVYNALMKNRADVTRCWFRVGERECRLYERLRLNRWKGRMPTYDSSLFDPRLHSWTEIAEAMCQAELVHETIIPLSLLPILAGRWFGAWPVFIVTSLLSACLDPIFVMLQRYNRPRVLRIARRQEARARGKAGE